jgi:hypothetical protein
MAKKKNATNRSRTPNTKEFLKFIAEDWAEPKASNATRW